MHQRDQIWRYWREHSYDTAKIAELLGIKEHEVERDLHAVMAARSAVREGLGIVNRG